MEPTRPGPIVVVPAVGLRGLSTAELVGRLSGHARTLVTDEVALARKELREDLRRELRMAAGLTVAVVFGICALALLLVAAAFGLGAVLPDWAAALVMAGVAIVVALAAAAYGWTRRVKRPLADTRRSVKENVEWARQRMH